MTHVLHGEGGVLVLGVDPDDAVAQSAHGQDGTGREGGAGHPWSGDRTRAHSDHPCIHTFQTEIESFELFICPSNDESNISILVYLAAYLRMATVMASGEAAHGQMTSGFSPWDWNTFRKASHDDTDPGGEREGAPFQMTVRQ